MAAMESMWSAGSKIVTLWPLTDSLLDSDLNKSPQNAFPFESVSRASSFLSEFIYLNLNLSADNCHTSNFLRQNDGCLFKPRRPMSAQAETSRKCTSQPNSVKIIVLLFFPRATATVI